MQAKALDLGTARLTILDVFPGVAGEAERALREGARLLPETIACDIDAETATRIRSKRVVPPWFTVSLAEHYGDLQASEPPITVYQSCHDLALERRAPFVPLLPRSNLGAIARLRAQRIFQSTEFPERELRPIALALRHKAESIPAVARMLDEEERRMADRLFTLAFREQQPGILAAISYPRSLRVSGFLVEMAERALGRPVVQGYR